MKHKGVISDVVAWKGARRFFYWRLRRRLCEQTVRRAIKAANTEMSDQQTAYTLRRWFYESKNAAYAWEDDAIATEWLCSQLTPDLCSLQPDSAVARNIRSLRSDHTLDMIRSLGQQDPDNALLGAMTLLQFLTPEQKAELKEALAKV